MNSSEIILTESAYQNQRLSGFNQDSWLEFWGNWIFLQDIQSSTRLNATLLAYLASILFLSSNTNKDVCELHWFQNTHTKYIFVTSPLPVQWAWTPCPCPSRRWLQCWWGRRAGWPGTARAGESRVELDLAKISCQTLKHETGIGPGKNSFQTWKHETGMGPGKTGGPGWPPGPPGPQLVAWHNMHLGLH